MTIVDFIIYAFLYKHNAKNNSYSLVSMSVELVTICELWAKRKSYINLIKPTHLRQGI